MDTIQDKIIKVVIADDHKIVRDGFKVLIKKHKRIKLVGEASNGLEMISLAHQLRPDVIVADIGMPQMDGLEATRRLTAALPMIRIIALSMFGAAIRIKEIMEAGARGYLIKNANPKEMLMGIEAVYRGEIFFCSESTKVLENEKLYKSSKHDLTWREIAIVKMLCEERSNEYIANELQLSPRTVEGYREKIMHKAGCLNLAGLALYASTHNLL
jgi:DNA-binding NarL/FixJ family response regulator